MGLYLRGFIFCLITLSSITILGQKVVLIKGTVKSKTDNEALIGASIRVNGTNIGTSTNVDGDFSITLDSILLKNAQLEVTYLGFKKQLIPCKDKTFFEIVLEEATNTLKEVVITSSYGTSKAREDITGSIQTITAEDLQVSQAVESFDKMLDGVAAGVIITAPSTIGGAVKIDIRGQGSLTPLTGSLVGSSTQPLIIIDGVIMAEESGFDNELFNGTGTLAEEFKNPLSKIAPEDIESISVLKDAAAVGLYGADAANGVILIKTKKSKNKKPTFNFSTQYGISQAINKIRYLSGTDFYELKKEYRIAFGDDEQQAAISAGKRDINTNWFDLLNRNGNFQRYSLSTSFGKGVWNFRASTNALRNNEAQIQNNFTRLGLNLNFGFITKKWSSQWVVTPSYIVQNTPNNLFSFAFPSNLTSQNSDGSYTEFGYNQLGNPLAVANQNTNNSKTIGGLFSWNITYQITKNFKISNIVGFNRSNKKQLRYFSAKNESGRYNGSFVVDDMTYPNWGRRLDYYRKSQRWNQSTQLFYEKTIDKHNFDVIVGAEIQRESSEAERLLGTGFLDPTIINEASKANSYSRNTTLSESARMSLISQFNYDFQKKYFVVLNIRRDQSSSFGGDTDPAINGGVGLSWNLHKESFLDDVSSLDLMKLRLSYGVTGNSRIGPYRSLGLYNQDLLTAGGYNGNPYAVPATAPNPNLSWERNYKFSVGLDLAFSKKYKATIEYFNDNIQDQIVSRNVSPEIGFSSLQINGASMYNRGLELSLAADWISSNLLSWKTSFNASTLSNKITSLLGLGSAYSTSERARAQRIGYPTSAIWGVRSSGIDPATGRELFIFKGEYYDAATFNRNFDFNDWEVIGNSQPSLYGGIQNTITYKALTFSIRGSYRWGEDLLIQDDLISKYTQIENRNLSINALNRWRAPGDIALHPSASPFHPIIPNSSRFLYDVSHFKIQNINFSYALKNIFNLKNANIYIDISNVYYFYRNKGADNENGIAELRFTYPEARTITSGLQINF